MSNYLIIGGNSDIGFGLAKYLIESNHNVVVVTRSKCKHAIIDCLKLIEGIDLLNEECLRKLCIEVENLFETNFNIIHSVGDFWFHKSMEDTKISEANNLIQSHYSTLFNVIKYLVPIQIKKGGGKLIAFSCNSVKYNYPYMAAFTSAKSAVECLVKCSANEFSNRNIIINAFALPSIFTEKVANSKPENFANKFITLNELCSTIVNMIENLSIFTNGNVIALFKYDDNFYKKGYLERNIIYKD